MRKPNSEIYKYVLNEHDLQAKRTLFIDDKKKILTLRFIRLTWNLQVGKTWWTYSIKHTIENPFG
jgi:putative hydrolase of the HAD superfamily